MDQGFNKFLGLVALGLFGAAIFFERFTLIAFLVISALLLSVIVDRKNGFGPFFIVLAALSPLSFGLVIFQSAKIVVPIEYLIIVIAPVVLLRYYRQSFALLKKYPWPALWILSFLPALFYSEMLAVSVKYIILNSLYVLVFYYGLLDWRDNGGKYSNLIIAFGLGLVVVLIYGFINYAAYDYNPITVSGLYKPFFYSHTYLGACLAFLAAFTWGKIKVAPWYLLAAIFFSLATLFTSSRAALWSLVVMAAFVLLLRLGPKARWIIPLLLISGGLGFGGLQKIEEVFTYNQYHSHDPNATLVENSMSVTNVQTDVSNIERLNRWVSALKMFVERPHTGFGPGTYQFTYIPFQEKELENRLTVKNPDYPPEGSGGTAHSELLLQLSENGWPSLLLFLVIVGRWFYFGFWPEVEKREILIPLFLGLITYFFHMNFNNFLNQPAGAFLFWSFGAILEHSSKTNQT
jgi:putative inorganic carbon (HCO3(-)) transporter